MNRKEFSLLGPGLHQINILESINFLFEINNKVARSTPALLPLETPEELADFLLKEHASTTYILNDGNATSVGYVSLVDADTNTMEILTIGVDPEFQGLGLGKKMMDFAEDAAKRKGLQKIKLVTNVKNKKAIKFYTAIGYSVAEEAENYYGDGETRYVFEKAV